MKDKTKRLILLTTVCILLTILTVLATTGAWFFSAKTTSGTITLKDGISLTYTGLYNTTPKTLILDNNDNVAPNAVISIENVTIKNTSTNSANVYLRYSFTYKYKLDNSSTWVDASAQDCKIAEEVLPFTTLASGYAFYKVGDYYYCFIDNSTLERTNLYTVSTNNAVTIFANMDGESSPAIRLVDDGDLPENLNIEISLNIEAIQATETAAEELWY